LEGGWLIPIPSSYGQNFSLYPVISRSHQVLLFSVRKNRTSLLNVDSWVVDQGVPLYTGNEIKQRMRRMKKYRAGKIKREHTVIEGVWPLLEAIAELDRAISVIPGPISPLKGRGLSLTFQRFTETGLRLLAKNGSAVQEVWVVAPQREALLADLREAGLLDNPPPAAPANPAAPMRGAEPVKTITLPSEMSCAACGRPMAAGSRAARLGVRNFTYMHVRCAK
jgi:hypothetical protein